MTVESYLRTSDLAKAAGISVQQVRNYEASGFIPVAERSPSGYRRYTGQHLAALTTARQLVGAYGIQRTQQIMQAVHEHRLAAALALIDERHGELARTREQLEQTLAALRLLTVQPAVPRHVDYAEGLRVGAAAALVGVRVSALRFWEQQGLLHPRRERYSNYRIYDEGQLRRLRIVALLRQANYDFEAIHSVLDELEAGQLQRAVAAIEARRSELARTSWRCVGAMAALHGYVNEFLGDQNV
ncbi:MAG: MerR family transcriptional regulator [Chloroflexaceae bacterium]|jgi:DNA-binding transcriptional MerR regulator|nr:MerR family transcriptional regulator [Chloroflexaceae bacterium]